MKRGSLLVASYYFPPHPAVGGLRWAALTKYLVQRGWTVHVVTAAAGPEGRAAEAPGVVVHRAPRRKTLDDRYNAWRAARSAASDRGASARADAESGSGDADEEAAGRGGGLRGLLQDAGYVLALPDDSRGWILRAASVIRSLRRRHTFDFVVTSGPPHGVHIAGALGSGRTPLILDLRDPWFYQIQRHKDRDIMPSRLSGWLEPKLADLTFRSARAAITNTPNFARELQQERPELPVALLQNGIDPDRLPRDEKVPVGRVISHVGSLYAGRDVGSVVRALRVVLDRAGAGDAATQIRLRLAGGMEPDPRANLLREMKAAGVEDQVELLGLVPQHEALELVRTSRLSVVLAQDQPLQIPAKLYESVGLGVPTLVIAPPDSASYQEALRVGARACAPGDVDAIAAAIEDTVLGEWPGRASPAKTIEYDALAGRLEALFGRFARGRDGRETATVEVAALDSEAAR